MKGVEFKPYTFQNSDEIAGYDIFINGEWHGSRRTIKQCEGYLKQIIGWPEKTP